MTAPRLTVRRIRPGHWAVQLWAASGRAMHTVASAPTGREALMLAEREKVRWGL
jgi:hypothetical protein